MNTILQEGGIDKLPATEITAALETFLEPVLMQLPEKRLREVAKLAVQGIIGGQSPLVTQMARGVTREDETIWPMAKWMCRFMWNRRFTHRELLKGLYGIAQRTVLWLRRLGGKLGLSSDRVGPYVLLAGIRAVFVTAATLTFASQHPPPRATRAT